MTIIVGLGNPGKEYENTRHNVGWQVLDAFAETLDGAWKTDKKVNALVFFEPSREVPLILLKPLTFMNNSGLAVAALLKQRKFSPATAGPRHGGGTRVEQYSSSEVKRSREVPLLVLHDDIDLPLGTVRVSFGSSSGGHNGVQSIIDHLKTKDFWRIRIGVAPALSPDQAPTAVGARGGATANAWKQKTDPARFVLQPFSKTEERMLKALLPPIHQIVRDTFNHPKSQTVHVRP